MNRLSSFSTLCLGAVLITAMSSCTPQVPDPEQLRLAHEQNDALRKEIIRMEQLITQAGELQPGLADIIETKEQALAAALTELTSLKRKETEAKLRVIELQDRRDAFRSSFRVLQSETANLHKRS